MTLHAPPALDRHIAIAGFMGAGKTTVGREVARVSERPFVDLDEEIERRHGPIPKLFEARGEAEFRRLEAETLAEVLVRQPSVIALGGGTVLSETARANLARAAFTVLLLVDVETAWERVGGSDRPLARDEASFRRLFDERRDIYLEAADALASDRAEDVLLEALAVHFMSEAKAASVEVDAVVADETVHALHPRDFGAPVHLVPPGEGAKRLDVARRLWDELALDRGGRLLAFGGGTTTDLTGFVAATYLRGVPWAALPTTLVGQVDAAIGGKTGIDLANGKNLVGAFHFPEAVLIEPKLLATLPGRERQNGMAEVVKTGLLAGRPLWELPEEEMIRAAAAFKCAVVISDPYEHGRRAILNLGHTFGHALEAASDYALPHGEAVALGLLAALRLSGQSTDVVDELLAPQPVQVDRGRAWAALGRDKKAREGRPQLVLLRAPGEPEYGVEVPENEVRAALDSLIAN